MPTLLRIILFSLTLSLCYLNLVYPDYLVPQDVQLMMLNYDSHNAWLLYDFDKKVISVEHLSLNMV